MLTKDVLYSFLHGYYEPLLQIEKSSEGEYKTIIMKKLRENIKRHEVSLIEDVFAPFLYHIKALNSFIDHRTIYSQVYNNILQKNIRVFFREYSTHLLDSFDEDPYQLLTNVQLKLCHYFSLFKILESIISSPSIIQSSCTLIDKIYKISSISIDYTRFKLLVILQTMYNQFLCDTFTVLFSDAFPSEYFISFVDNEPKINYDHLPNFVSPDIPDKICFIVRHFEKFSNDDFIKDARDNFKLFIRQQSVLCNDPTPIVDEYKFIDVAEFNKNVTDIYEYISTRLWRRTVEGEKVFLKLNLLIDLSLIRRGDVFLAFLQGIFEKSNHLFSECESLTELSNFLCLPYEEFSQNLNSINFFLDDSYQRTLKRIFPSLYGSLLQFKVKLEHQTNNNNEGEVQKTGQKKIIDVIGIIIRPVHSQMEQDSIFTEEILHLFSAFFSHFIRIHMSSYLLRVNLMELLDVQRILTKERLCDASSPNEDIINLRIISLLYSNMNIFLNYLFDFYYIDVVEGQLVEFMTETKKKQTIDSLELGIDSLLRNIRTLCFIDNEQLVSRLERILHDIDSLKVLWVEKREKLPTIAEVYVINNSFRINVKRFIIELKNATKFTKDLEKFSKCSFQSLINRLKYFDKLYQTE